MPERRRKLEVTQSTGIGVLLTGVLALVVALFGLANAGAGTTHGCGQSCPPAPIHDVLPRCGCTTTTPPPPPPSCGCTSTTTTTAPPATEVTTSTAVLGSTTIVTTTTAPPTTMPPTTAPPTTAPPTTAPPTTAPPTTAPPPTAPPTTAPPTTGAPTTAPSTTASTTTTSSTVPQPTFGVVVQGVTTLPSNVGPQGGPVVTPEANNGVLPFTGTSALPLAGFGLTMVGAGWGLLRRKQRRLAGSAAGSTR